MSDNNNNNKKSKGPAGADTATDAAAALVLKKGKGPAEIADEADINVDADADTKGRRPACADTATDAAAALVLKKGKGPAGNADEADINVSSANANISPAVKYATGNSNAGVAAPATSSAGACASASTSINLNAAAFVNPDAEAPAVEPIAAEDSLADTTNGNTGAGAQPTPKFVYTLVDAFISVLLPLMAMLIGIDQTRISGTGNQVQRVFCLTQDGKVLVIDLCGKAVTIAACDMKRPKRPPSTKPLIVAAIVTALPHKSMTQTLPSRVRKKTRCT